jgi:hypothetical protein
MRRWLLLLALVGCAEAKEAKSEATKATERALGLGKRVKNELDKVYKTTKDYDVIIEEGPALAEHDAKLAAMPHVNIGGLDVAYEESSTLSVNGSSYSKHFRATWRDGDRVVAISYFTKEEIDAAAFIELLKMLIPIVQRQL